MRYKGKFYHFLENLDILDEYLEALRGERGSRANSFLNKNSHISWVTGAFTWTDWDHLIEEKHIHDWYEVHLLWEHEIHSRAFSLFKINKNIRLL